MPTIGRPTCACEAPFRADARRFFGRRGGGRYSARVPRCAGASKPMTQAHVPTDWHPASWQSRHAAQQPVYRDRAHLESVLAQLSNLPPVVTTWEVENLKSQLATAQRGEAFLLPGGDCAESFDECTSDNVVQTLKILLQMSLVMLVGLKKPIIRVGRMAGQYAK